MAALLTTFLAAGPGLGLPQLHYFALESEKALDCIEAWEQLCSAPQGPWFDVAIGGERVVITPYMDGGATFRIVRRGEGFLDLAFESCELGPCAEGAGATGRLSARSSSEAAWDGADVAGVISGVQGAAEKRIHIELYSSVPHLARHAALERELVPFGRCGDLMVYAPVGGRRCLNRPGERPEGHYTTLAALRKLDCVRGWEEVCASASPGESGEVEVWAWKDRVEVGPSGGRVVVFKVTQGEGRTRDLIFERCISGEPACARLGNGAQAKLEEGSDGLATFDGVDVRALLAGTRASARLELVSFPRYWARLDELQRRLVPGGKCDGPRPYPAEGGKPCLDGARGGTPGR